MLLFLKILGLELRIFVRGYFCGNQVELGVVLLEYEN